VAVLPSADAGFVPSTHEGDDNHIPFDGLLDTASPITSMVVTLEYINSRSGEVMYATRPASVVAASRSTLKTYGFTVSGTAAATLAGGEWSLRVDARSAPSLVTMKAFRASTAEGVVSGTVAPGDLRGRISEGLLELP
jgi:hypothetical protein